jgi:hypothetical protein
MNLRRVLDHPGPFATVHLDASHDTENAAHELELRWRAAREELAAEGAGADVLAALDEAVRSTTPAVGKAGWLLVAAGEDVLVNRLLPDPPPTPVTRFGPLPYLVPLVGRDAGQVPYVAALVNKVGADVRVVDADGVVRTEHTTEGSDHPVHKVRAGGWSHLHIQHNVEETVQRNVRLVVQELAALVDDVHARLLAIAGEPQVVAAIVAELPPRCGAIVAEVPGRREADDEFDRVVADLAAERARAEHDTLVERFRDELATDDGLAVQGLRDTVAALREHNATAVVLGDLADTTLWYSTEPRSVALTSTELTAVGAENPTEARADEVLPDFCLRVGAEVLRTPEPLIGVLLRHP